MRALATSAPCLGLLAPAYGAPDELPVIDAHSQFDEGVTAARVLEYLARAGVTRALLSARGRTTTAQVVSLAAAQPGCVVASVRTKGRVFDENSPAYYAMLEEQFKEPSFGAMSEIILVHAPKGKRAPEVNVAAESPQAKEAIRRAVARGWPVVLHYELRWLARARGGNAVAERMRELRSLLAQYPQHPFALIHMAQLDAPAAAELIAHHPNVVFLTSHANTLSIQESRQPWTDMFSGDALAPEWKELVLRHPERFVLAIDNVWPEHWSDAYVRQVALWRHALGQLPPEVAHAVAHRNAERLWKLPPAAAGQRCEAPRS
jgi:predicted TIM-barrel fold metal-dependent hydrolase